MVFLFVHEKARPVLKFIHKQPLIWKTIKKLGVVHDEKGNIQVAYQTH